MFERSFTLPSEIEADKIAATFEKGVLKITLPKAPQAVAQVKKIAIRPAA
jgi:HSP20 family protein